MRSILMIIGLLVLVTCGTTSQVLDSQRVSPITETKGCRFITTAYFEVSHPSKMHKYAVKNTLRYGGDSYVILSTGEEQTFLTDIYTTNIGIYNCGRPK